MALHNHMPPQFKKTPEELSITEQFYNQVSESIKSVFDLTSRIDERVKMLMEKQNELDDKFEKIMEQYSTLATRFAILETKAITDGTKIKVDELDKRLAAIELHDAKHRLEDLDTKVQNIVLRLEGLSIFKSGEEAKWARIVDVVFKIGVGIAIAYIIWANGLKT